MCGYARQSLRGLVCLQQTQHTFREPILIYRKVDPNFTTYISGTLSLVWDVLYDDNCHNTHLGNQFSSEKWWVPNFTTCISGTLSLVWDVLYDDNCHNIHLGNQFSSEKWWVPNFMDLIAWSHIDFQQKINKTLIIVLLGRIDFMSLFQTRQDSFSSEDHTCHCSCLGRQTKFIDRKSVV